MSLMDILQHFPTLKVCKMEILQQVQLSRYVHYEFALRFVRPSHLSYVALPFDAAPLSDSPKMCTF